MISKEKMFIVADNIDDTIQSQATGYDIRVFKVFTNFEKYINENPVILDTIVITERVLPFTGQNMQRLMQVMASPFVKLNGHIIYLVKEAESIEKVNTFLETMQLDNWVVYQGDLSVKFITDIVVGTGRDFSEGVNEIVTYRVRASEYIKQQNQLKYETDDNRYMTDEDLLSGIPDIEEPEELSPSIGECATINYIVGKRSLEGSLMCFFLAQYFGMKERAIIIEKDTEYHMLGEILTKSNIDFEYITVEDLYKDISTEINKIKNSAKKLVFIGTKEKRSYDYNFLFDILYSNLKDDFGHFIKECDYEETPYGRYYTVVLPNTVPALLECCNSLKYDLNPEEVTFVGLQTSNLGPINIVSKEMKMIAEFVLNKNGIEAQVIHANGLLLKGEQVVYDIFGVLNRSN